MEISTVTAITIGTVTKIRVGLTSGVVTHTTSKLEHASIVQVCTLFILVPISQCQK